MRKNNFNYFASLFFTLAIILLVTIRMAKSEELIESDPVLISSYFNGQKWEYEFEMAGSEYLLDLVKKVRYQRWYNGKEWRQYCWTTKRSANFHCTVKTKIIKSKIRVILERKGKLDDIVTYFETEGKEVKFLGSFHEWGNGYDK